MTQSWRTLGAVALSAMAAGWLVMRVLGPNPEVTPVDHPPPEGVVLRASPVPETTHGREQAASMPGQLAGTSDPQAHREQELVTLENALLRDHRINDLLFSYPGVTSFPSVINYRRPMDFWGPAFARAARSR